jgi:hypothetical protein
MISHQCNTIMTDSDIWIVEHDQHIHQETNCKRQSTNSFTKRAKMHDQKTWMISFYFFRNMDNLFIDLEGFSSETITLIFTRFFLKRAVKIGNFWVHFVATSQICIINETQNRAPLLVQEANGNQL